MFCTKCGAEVPDQAVFCGKCGHRLKDAVTAPLPVEAGGATHARPAQQQAAQPAQQTAQQPAQQAAPEVYFQPAYEWKPAAPTKKGVDLIPIIAGIAVAAVVLVALLMGGLGLPGGKGSGAAPTSSEPSQPDPSSTEPQDEPEEEETVEEDGPAIRDTVDAYSWEELSEIAALISAESDQDGALAVATKYHLCAADGTLDGTQTKSVTLTNGIEAEAMIIGFAHDAKADGTGNAGITFLFKGAIAARQMNASDANDGGWESSDMRSWLSSDGMALMPSDLASVIVPVSKLTNNTGVTDKASSVTATTDSLWLLSFAEIADSSYLSHMSADHLKVYKVVWPEEGERYQLFADCGVKWNKANADLRMPMLASGSKEFAVGTSCNWWGRSADPGIDYYYHFIFSDGDPNNYEHANSALGVVPGFCI